MSNTAIEVHDIKKITNITKWCKRNLKNSEWQMVPVNLFKPDYRFQFNCPKIKLQVILQHL
jgi:hypothetical protein